MGRPAHLHFSLSCLSGTPAFVAAIVLLGVSCGGGTDTPPAAAPDPVQLVIDDWESIATRDGAYVVRWRPTGGRIVLNEPFEVDIEIVDAAGASVPGARVDFDCTMPHHGHGMVRRAITEEVAGGTYHVRGPMLHMGGEWTVTVTVVVDGLGATGDARIVL